MEEGQEQYQSQGEMLGDVGLVVGDLVFVVCLNFEPWPGKIKRINIKGQERIYNVDFYNHNTYVNQPAQNLQIISDLQTIQKFREKSQKYQNKKIRTDVLKAIDMVQVQFQRRQLIMSEEPKLWRGVTPSLEEIKRQKNLLTMEVNRTVFKAKDKWVRKEQIEAIQKKKEEYQNKRKVRKRKNVPEPKKEDKVEEEKKAQKKSRRQKSKSLEKQQREPVSSRLKEKKKQTFESALAKVVKQQQSKKKHETKKSKSERKKRDKSVKAQQNIRKQERMKDENQELRKREQIQPHEKKSELEKEKIEAEQIHKEELAQNKDQNRMIPQDKKEEEKPIQKQQQDSKKAIIQQEKVTQLSWQQGWKRQKQYNRQLQKLQKIVLKQYPRNAPMKIKQFKPENKYIQKYRNLIKNKDEIVVGDVSQQEDEDVVKMEEIYQSRQNCYISNHRPVGRFPRKPASPFENLSTQIVVVQNKEESQMDNRPVVDIWALAMQFSKQQEVQKESKTDEKIQNSVQKLEDDENILIERQEDQIVKQKQQPAISK